MSYSMNIYIFFVNNLFCIGFLILKFILRILEHTKYNKTNSVSTGLTLYMYMHAIEFPALYFKIQKSLLS